jgi:hypothetical protein
MTGIITGIITGYKVGKNMNGTKNVLLLQVRISDSEDIQTVEYRCASGDDSFPVIGSEVLVLQITKTWKIGIAVKDQIEPEMSEGERRLYSQENGEVKAYIKILKDGTIEINGKTDFAVAYTDLNAALQAFLKDLNTKLTTAFTAVGESWTGISLDISGSKLDEVKVP